MTMATPTAPPMVPEAAIASLRAHRAHIEEFIALELTGKLDAQLASLARSGVLELDKWDGANLVLPRTVTTALLEAAAERVIWHSHRRRYQIDINRLKQSRQNSTPQPMQPLTPRGCLHLKEAQPCMTYVITTP